MSALVSLCGRSHFTVSLSFIRVYRKRIRWWFFRLFCIRVDLIITILMYSGNTYVSFPLKKLLEVVGK